MPGYARYLEKANIKAHCRELGSRAVGGEVERGQTKEQRQRGSSGDRIDVADRRRGKRGREAGSRGNMSVGGHGGEERVGRGRQTKCSLCQFRTAEMNGPLYRPRRG